MIQTDDRLIKKNTREKREYNKIKEKLFEMPLSKNKEDFEKYLNIKKQKTNYGTLTNRVYDLIKLLSWFPNRRVLDLREDEILNFFSDLDEDEVKYTSTKKRKKNDKSTIEESVYTYETKTTIKKSIKTYFRTLYGEYEFIKRYANLKGLKNPDNPVHMPVISFEECKKVLNGILYSEKNTERKLRDMFIFAFLFESGCRSCELQAMKIKDIYYKEEELDEEGLSIKKGTLVAFIPKVKTISRPIAIDMFDFYVTKYTENLKNEKKLTQEDFLLNLTSKSIRSIVNNRSVQFLGEEKSYMTTHLLRHSSAYFFSEKKHGLDWNKFTKRFGWSITSKEAKRYYDRNDVIMTEVVESIAKSDSLKYEFKSKKLSKEVEILKKQNIDIQKGVDEQNLKIEMLMEAVKIEKTEKLKNKSSKCTLPVKGDGLQNFETCYDDNEENKLIKKLGFIEEHKIMNEYCKNNIKVIKDEKNNIEIIMKIKDFDNLWKLATNKMKKEVFMDDFNRFKNWVGYILVGFNTSIESRVEDELENEFPKFIND